MAKVGFRRELLGFNREDVIEYIKKKGMIPGVWLEIDSVSPGTKFAEEYADCLLKINGDNAGSS